MSEQSFAWRWLTAILEDPNRNPYTITLCIAVYRYLSGDRRVVNLSDQQFSEIAGMSLSSVKRHKKVVLKLGFIRVKKVGISSVSKTDYEAVIPPTGIRENLVSERRRYQRGPATSVRETPELVSEGPSYSGRRRKQRNNKPNPCSNAEKNSPTSLNSIRTSPRFDEWWEEFPAGRSEGGASRKLDKPQCRKQYAKIVTGKHPDLKATDDELIAAAVLYASENAEPLFISSPLKWLNGGRWEAYGDKLKPWWTKLDAPLTPEHGRAILDKHLNGHWDEPALGPEPNDPESPWHHLRSDLFFELREYIK